MPVWEVVGGGGGDKGGILVRKGQALDSAACSGRLSTGAAIEELELVGQRLHYKLLAGTGPAEGWVSTNIKGKDLVTLREGELGDGAGPKIVIGEPSAGPGKSDLRDPAYPGNLEVNEIEVAGLKAAIRNRPDGAPKAPMAVLMIPGNPVMNSWHSGMELPLAMEEAFAKAGFPVVRFDWNGHGMNKFTGHPLNQGYEDKIPIALMMYEVAKALGDHVVACTWNYSGSLLCAPWEGVKVIDLMPEVCGVVSLSFAYNQWKHAARFVHELVGLQLKSELEAHSTLSCPAIYVFGSRDVHTPLEDVERILKERSDGGRGAEIYHVNQEGQKLHPPEFFALKDREDEAAYVSAAWLCDLRSAILSAESLFLGA